MVAQGVSILALVLASLGAFWALHPAILLSLVIVALGTPPLSYLTRGVYRSLERER